MRRGALEGMSSSNGARTAKLTVSEEGEEGEFGGELAGMTRRQQALKLAQERFAKSKDWVTFFRQTVGVNGEVHALFNTEEEKAEFEQSDEFREIQQMLRVLRGKRTKKKGRTGDREPTKVITVRMPKSLHELLRDQAEKRGTSINELCISKLLQLGNVGSEGP